MESNKDLAPSEGNIDPMENLVFDKGLYFFVKSLQEISGMDDDEAGAVYHILEMWDKKKYVPKESYTLPNGFLLDEAGIIEVPKKLYQHFTKDGIIESGTTHPVTVTIKKDDYGRLI